MKPAASFSLGLTLLILQVTRAAVSYPAACSLITKTDVEAALSEPVGEPRSENTSAGSATMAAISRCQFDPAQPVVGRSVSLMARFSPVANPSAAESVRGSLKMMGGNPKDIAGVGDKALWVFGGAGRYSSGRLNVFSKGTVYLIVTIAGISEEAAALDKAKILALKALSRV